MRFSFAIGQKIIDFSEYMTWSNQLGAYTYVDGNREKMIAKRFPHLVNEYYDDLNKKEKRSNREADLSRKKRK
jgi:hypothetical protein